MLRTVLTTAVLGGILSLGALHVAHADETPQLSRDSAKVGDTVTVTGTNCDPSARVDVFIGGQRVSVRPNDAGYWSASMYVPPLPPGDEVLLAVCAYPESEKQYPEITLTIVADEAPDGGDPWISVSGSNRSTRAGATHTLEGGMFGAGDEVEIRIAGANSDDPGIRLTTVTADGDGEIRARLTIPKRFQPGTYVVSAAGSDGRERASVELVVKGHSEPEQNPTSKPNRPTPPKTGN